MKNYSISIQKCRIDRETGKNSDKWEVYQLMARELTEYGWYSASAKMYDDATEVEKKIANIILDGISDIDRFHESWKQYYSRLADCDVEFQLAAYRGQAINLEDHDLYTIRNDVVHGARELYSLVDDDYLTACKYLRGECTKVWKRKLADAILNGDTDCINSCLADLRIYKDTVFGKNILAVEADQGKRVTMDMIRRAEIEHLENQEAMKQTSLSAYMDWQAHEPWRQLYYMHISYSGLEDCADSAVIEKLQEYIERNKLPKNKSEMMEHLAMQQNN